MNWFSKNEKCSDYHFSVEEISNIGNTYRYKVKAKNKKEAFYKLVRWFYSSSKGISDDVEYNSSITSYTNKSSFTVCGMPNWFGKCISGIRDKTANKELLKYCKNNNIRIKE